MRGLSALVLMGLAAGAAGPVRAAELAIHGDAKSYTVAAFPYDSLLLPEDPLGVGALDLRLKAELTVGRVEVVAHHQLTLTASTAQAPGEGGLGLISLGGRASAVDEAVTLSWTGAEGGGFTLGGRMDRLYARLSVPHLDLTLGRQPVSFGTTFFFTPLDLVAPFTPATIDREYKPGVDAARADLFLGTSGRITAVAAYAGGWDLDGLILATHAGGTVGLWDLGLFLASARGDAVLGADAAGSVGAVAVRGEASLTFPDGDEATFGRVALGADRRWDAVGLSGEVYWQSLGASQPAGYLEVLTGPRVARGELWAAGRWYAALSADYELDPTLVASAFSVVNLQDPSSLVGLGLAWSVADNAAVDLGAYLGAGERPDGLVARSEFGLYPASVYALMRAYF